MATAYDQIIDEGQRIKATIQLGAGQSKIWTDPDDFSFRPSIDGRVSANHKAFVPFRAGNDYKIKTGQTYIFDRTIQLTIHYPPSVYDYDPEEEVRKQIIDPSNRLSGSQFVKAGEVVVWENSEYYNFAPIGECRLSVGNQAFIQLTGGELILIRHDFNYIFDRDLLLEVGFPPDFFKYPGVYSGGVPIGAIVMYSGAFIDIPENWKVCDGSNGTPDLTNQFIMGALLEGDIGDKGGSPDAVTVDHTHNAEQVGHVHNVTADQDSHDHNVTATQDAHDHSVSASQSEHDHNVTATQDAHDHNVSVSGGTHSHSRGDMEITGNFSSDALGLPTAPNAFYNGLIGDREGAFHTSSTINVEYDRPVIQSVDNDNDGYSFDTVFTASKSWSGRTSEEDAVGDVTEDSVAPAITVDATPATPAISISETSVAPSISVSETSMTPVINVDENTITPVITVDNTGTSGAGANNPAYYKLAFIRRMS